MSAWRRTLYIVFFAQLVSSLGFSIIWPFFTLYVNDLGTRTTLSLEFWAAMVFSAQAITMMFASPIWGAMADRRGRKIMIERATFGGAIIIFLMAFVSSAEELAFLRALQGLVTGVIAANNAMVASVAPREKLGQALGTLQLGRWIGVAMGPLLGGVIAETLGYAAPFILTAGMLFVGGLLVYFGIEEEFEAPPKKEKPHFQIFQQWGSVFRQSGVKTLYSLRFASWFAQSVNKPFIPLLLILLVGTEDGVAMTVGLISGLAAFASTVTAVTLGRLGDRIGHRQIAIASSLATAAFYIPLLFINETWQFIALYVCGTAAIGGLLPSLGALLAHYTKHGEEGSAYGLENSIVSAAGSIAPLIGAILVDTFGLQTPFFITGIIFLGMAITAISMLPPQPRTSQALASTQISMSKA